MPGYANPQNLNRYSYVVNNPLRYIDPSGHKAVCGEYGEECSDEELDALTGGGTGGGSHDDDEDENEDITLNGVPDSVTITLTTDELADVVLQINNDLYGPGGLVNDAENSASQVTIGNAVVTTVIEIALCTNLLSCPAALAIVALGEDVAVGFVANGFAQAEYEDLQNTALYLNEAVNSAQDNGDSEVTIQIFTNYEGGPFIQAGNQEPIPIAGGPYYYNYEIAPYLQPYAP